MQNLEKKLLSFKNLKKPIIITDPSDNVGGGALGSNTEILEILLKYKLSGTIVIWAPSLREKSYKENLFNNYVGPNYTYTDNKSLKLNGNIIFKATNFVYERDELYMTGQKVKMGNVLVIKTKFNLKVILTENRVMPFDSKHISVFGIDPNKEDIIVTKSGSAWKIAFGKIAKTLFNVDTNGICSSNVKKFRYSYNNIKNYWPLNE